MEKFNNRNKKYLNETKEKMYSNLLTPDYLVDHELLEDVGISFLIEIYYLLFIKK